MPSRLMPLYPEDRFTEKLLETARRIIEADCRISNCLPEATLKGLTKMMQVLEVKQSCAIEGIHAPLESFFVAPGPHDSPDIAAAVRLYRAADRLQAIMQHYRYSAHHPDVAVMLHKQMFDGVQPMPDGLVPGAYRTQQVQVGQHVSAEAESVPSMMHKMAEFHDRATTHAAKVVSALGLHHRFVWIHPFVDGNGRISRFVLQEMLREAGLSGLWSISNGLSIHDEQYRAKLAAADHPRMGDFDGRGNLSQSRFVSFIEFMLDVCKEQVEYTRQALNRQHLSKVIDDYFADKTVLPSGVNQDSHLAWKALFFQGVIPRGEFKRMIPKSDRTATAQVAALVKGGLVISPTSKSDLTPAIPLDLAKRIFAFMR